MRRWLPFPLLWALFLATWLLFNQTMAAGQVILGGLLALGGVLALAALQWPQPTAPPRATRRRRARAAASLAWVVLAEMVRSNIGVAGIVSRPGRRDRHSGFLDIPLELRHPVGLALLACIITANPGTAWARYDPERGILTMHILDLIDEEAWIATIKDRYERRLLEIFQ